MSAALDRHAHARSVSLPRGGAGRLFRATSHQRQFVLGMLTASNTVELAGACQDNWCKVRGAAVPTGTGWVYDGPDYDSLAF